MPKGAVNSGDRAARGKKTVVAINESSGNGRRSTRRYTVDLSMHCKLSGAERVVAGRVCDISSSGIRFQSAEPLPPGVKVELLIEWPVLLNGKCRLHLKGSGRIVRSDGRGIAASITRYEFYTAGTSGAKAFTTELPLGNAKNFSPSA